MKAKEARTYVAECVAAINEAKKTSIKVLTDSVYKMRSVAKAADHIRITIEVEPFLCFDLCLDLFLKISDRNKREYQEALMTEIWMRAREIINKQKQLQQINTISSSSINNSKATLLTKDQYNNLMARGKIEQDKLYIIQDEDIGTPRVSAIWRNIKTDPINIPNNVQADLDSYRIQQVLKQHRDDLLNNSGVKKTDPIQVAIDNKLSADVNARLNNTHTWDLDDIDF